MPRPVPALPLGDMGLLPAPCPTNRLRPSRVRPTASGRGTASPTAQPRPAPAFTKGSLQPPCTSQPFRPLTGLSAPTEPSLPHTAVPTDPRPTLSSRSSAPHSDRAPSVPLPGSAGLRTPRAGELRRSPARGCRRRGAPAAPPSPTSVAMARRAPGRAVPCRAGGTAPHRRRLRGRAEPRGAGRCPRCCRAEGRRRARPPRVRSRPVRRGPPRGTGDGRLPPPARSPCGRRHRVPRGWLRRGAARECGCCASRGSSRASAAARYLRDEAGGP